MSHRPARYKSDLNFLIERKLREAGIEIPFPQRDLHIRSSEVDFGNRGSDRQSADNDGARA
jgi:small-conductance mechanosensitive channel